MKTTPKWILVANVARITRHTINTTGLCSDDFPPGLVSFIMSQTDKMLELTAWENEQLKNADTMDILDLQSLVDTLYSGWVRAKLCEILEKRSNLTNYKTSV
jgi:hypothetical protein